MTEKELIGKIRGLRQIKPNKDWAVLTKSQILGKEESKLDNIISVFHVFFLKPAYAGLIVVFILFGLFGISQNSLPGDILYPIKKISERSQAVFVSEEELPKVQLGLANKKIEELNKIVQTNQVRKLAPAISEVQTSVSEVTKNLAKSEKADKEMVGKVVNLRKNLEEMETTLATKISSQEDEQIFQSWEEEQAEMLIEDLKTRTLTEAQEELFAQAKEDYEAGNYSDALIKILILSQSQE